MITAIPLFPLYVFMVWTGKTLIFYLLIRMVPASVHFPYNFNDVAIVYALVSGSDFYLNAVIGHYIYFFHSEVLLYVVLG
jgi:hypothetical protein